MRRTRHSESLDLFDEKSFGSMEKAGDVFLLIVFVVDESETAKSTGACLPILWETQ
jgi:hypothetical protein